MEVKKFCYVVTGLHNCPFFTKAICIGKLASKEQNVNMTINEADSWRSFGYLLEATHCMFGRASNGYNKVIVHEIPDCDHLNKPVLIGDEKDFEKIVKERHNVKNISSCT